MGWLALAYIAALWLISYFAGRRISDKGLDTFYVARRRGHWLWVSYGMIGTALSGLTFISLPGSVQRDGWTYMQVVGGYFLGYVGIAYVLLPLYYRHARASIYEYFRYRLGTSAEKTATGLFLISRGIGSSLRLFLALWALQQFFPALPFPLLSAVSLALILLYAARSGIAALIYTDFFQTTVFLIAAAVTAYELWQVPIESCFHIPHFIDFKPDSPHFWIKDLTAGALIALSMTGLDQDQMQKNLSLPTLREAQKNLLVYGALLFPVNFLFLLLGSTLWAYLSYVGLSFPRPDEAFTTVAQHVGVSLQIPFVLGVTAAALSSADGTITALTTVTLRNLLPPRFETPAMKNLLMIGWSLFFWLLLGLYAFLPREGPILSTFLTISGYTYGPLLGLFLFSRLVQRPKPIFRFIPAVILASILIAIGLEQLLALKLGYSVILLTAFLSLTALLLLNQVSRS
ncbi:MAG: hypothetical protein N2170_02250 [Bacteroidia bacterium]|nr:hypothetical protein [Bacteroidia bacterium]